MSILQQQHRTENIYEGTYDFIETYTGLAFYPGADQPAFCIEDIAHALAQCTRYNGHAKYFYSIAEHSILVADIMSNNNMVGSPFEGLMHDATEAYLSDVPAPFKQHLPDWQDFDHMLEHKLRDWLGFFATDRPDSVKQADWIALFIECQELLPNKGENFADPMGLREVAMELAPYHQIHGHTPTQAETFFRGKYNRLLALAKHGGVVK